MASAFCMVAMKRGSRSGSNRRRMNGNPIALYTTSKLFSSASGSTRVASKRPANLHRFVFSIEGCLGGAVSSIGPSPLSEQYEMCHTRSNKPFYKFNVEQNELSILEGMYVRGSDIHRVQTRTCAHCSYLCSSLSPESS